MDLHNICDSGRVRSLRGIDRKSTRLNTLSLHDALPILIRLVALIFALFDPSTSWTFIIFVTLVGSVHSVERGRDP